MLRSCYSTTVRLDASGRERTVKWFWADPGAKVFSGPHRYGSLNWSSDLPVDDGQVGEIPGAPRPYYNGQALAHLSGLTPDGPLPMWRDGVPAEWVGLALDSDGMPIKCARNICGCANNVQGFRFTFPNGYDARFNLVISQSPWDLFTKSATDVFTYSYPNLFPLPTFQVRCTGTSNVEFTGRFNLTTGQMVTFQYEFPGRQLPCQNVVIPFNRVSVSGPIGLLGWPPILELNRV